MNWDVRVAKTFDGIKKVQDSDQDWNSVCRSAIIIFVPFPSSFTVYP